MRKIRFVGLLSLSVLVSDPAFSQEATQPPGSKATEQQVEKITVTATKREESLQEVPLSVSVTSAATIEQAHIRDLIDLQSVVPSLKVTQFNAVGQTNFPKVAHPIGALVSKGLHARVFDAREPPCAYSPISERLPACTRQGRRDYFAHRRVNPFAISPG